MFVAAKRESDQGAKSKNNGEQKFSLKTQGTAEAT